MIFEQTSYFLEIWKPFGGPAIGLKVVFDLKGVHMILGPILEGPPGPFLAIFDGRVVKH